MLADAVFSEAYRLLKNRTVWFWSVLFIPVISLTLTVIGNLFLRSKGDALLAKGDAPPELAMTLSGGAIDIGQALLKIAADLSNPVLLLFVLIGAATVYTGDYRWETWRLITPRNGRDNLLLGKVGVVKLLVLAAMLALLVSDLGKRLVEAAVMAKPLAFTFGGHDLGAFVGLFLVSYWRIIQFLMIALLVAVLSRSMLAALFVTLVVGVAQFLSMQILAPIGLKPDDWLPVLLNPGAAADTLKAWVSGGQAAAMLQEGAVLKAVVSQLLWAFGPFFGALAAFRQQDLSKE